MKILFTTSFIIFLSGCSSLPAEYKNSEANLKRINHLTLTGETSKSPIEISQVDSVNFFKSRFFNNDWIGFISNNGKYYIGFYTTTMNANAKYFGDKIPTEPYITMRFCNLNSYSKQYGCQSAHIILNKETNKMVFSYGLGISSWNRFWIETDQNSESISFAFRGNMSYGETKIQIKNNGIELECSRKDASCFARELLHYYYEKDDWDNAPTQYIFNSISLAKAREILAKARSENSRWLAEKRAQKDQNFSAFMTGLNVALTEANQVMSERVNASQQSLDETMERMAIQAAKEREQQNVARISSQQTSRTSTSVSSSSQNSTTNVNLPQKVITSNNLQANTKQLEEQRKKDIEQRELAIQKKLEEEKRKKEFEKQKQEELKQAQEAKKKQELLAYNRAIRAGTRVGAISCGSKNQARIVGVLGRAQRPSHVHTKCSLEEVRYRCPAESGWRYRSQDLWVLNNACIGVGDDVAVSNTNCPAEQLIVEPTRFTCDTN